MYMHTHMADTKLVTKSKQQTVRKLPDNQTFLGTVNELLLELARKNKDTDSSLLLECLFSHILSSIPRLIINK